MIFEFQTGNLKKIQISKRWFLIVCEKRPRVQLQKHLRQVREVSLSKKPTTLAPRFNSASLKF